MEHAVGDQVAIDKKVRPTLRGVPDVVATCVAIPAVVILARAAEPGLGTFSAIMFGLGLIFMLGMSALYHTPTWSPRVLARLQRLDHAGVFALIAGSYTAFCLSIDMPYARILLAIAVTACGLGALRVLFFPLGGRMVRAAIYVVIGVSVAPCAHSLYTVAGPGVFALIGGGGALYIMGAGIYVAKRPNPFPGHFGSHEVFHLFVFAAAICHYLAVWQIVTPAAVA